VATATDYLLFKQNQRKERKMPKSRAPAGKGQKNKPVTVKFKLGGRKSTLSALSLSTDELKARLENDNYSKERNKILKVLSDRGVTV
jgi:hypothetical protein